MITEEEIYDITNTEMAARLLDHAFVIGAETMTDAMHALGSGFSGPVLAIAVLALRKATGSPWLRCREAAATLRQTIRNMETGGRSE